MNHHLNNGNCGKCDEIFDKYPDFHEGLRSWFKRFQAAHPEAHISCAGRGKADQEAEFLAKRSRARFGQSSHNCNCAIDIFCIIACLSIYDRGWFNTVLEPEIPEFIEWYGRPNSVFPELPHCEVKEWKGLFAQDLVKLVEAA